MDGRAQKVEIHVDDDAVPAQVIEAPPFEVAWDTTGLSDGDHVLTVTTHLEDGRTVRRRVPIRVDNGPEVALDGLEADDVVRGTVAFSVRVGDEAQVEAPARGPGAWAYLGPTVAALGAVWAFFAFVAPPAASDPAPAGDPAAAAHPPAAEAPPPDPALLAQGERLFQDNCASCHQPHGMGIPGAFPPLAGNANLKDPGLVVRTIRHGRSGTVRVGPETYQGTMPPIGATFTPTELAAVATYVRNAWGNRYGGVDPAQVPELAQKKDL